MSKIRWLGDAVDDCKANQSNRDQCAAFATSVGPATGTWPLMQFYRDQCLNYLCDTGTIPSSTSQLPAPPPLYEMFPWGVYAAETSVLQAELNKKLKADGLCPIDTKGTLGPITCGAAAKYGVNIPTCAGHASTTPKPCGSGVAKKEEPTPPVANTMPTSPSTSPSTSPWGWIIGGVALVGIAWIALTPRPR